MGSPPEDLQPLGVALAARRPGAWVVSVRAAHRSDLGRGWQWFSVQGVTEADRPVRPAGAVATLDVFPDLGHGIDTRVLDTVLSRLG